MIRNGNLKNSQFGPIIQAANYDFVLIFIIFTWQIFTHIGLTTIMDCYGWIGRIEIWIMHDEVRVRPGGTGGAGGGCQKGRVEGSVWQMKIEFTRGTPVQNLIWAVHIKSCSPNSKSGEGGEGVEERGTLFRRN